MILLNFDCILLDEVLTFSVLIPDVECYRSGVNYVYYYLFIIVVIIVNCYVVLVMVMKFMVIIYYAFLSRKDSHPLKLCAMLHVFFSIHRC